jgi:hypothetical protein
MPTEPSPPTLAEVVHRAAEACDPEGVEEESEIVEQKGAVDPQDEDPAVTMAAAVAVYLAYRRDEVGDDPDRLLRLAARAEFEGEPPGPVADWLAARGISA